MHVGADRRNNVDRHRCPAQHTCYNRRSTDKLITKRRVIRRGIFIIRRGINVFGKIYLLSKTIQNECPKYRHKYAKPTGAASA